MLERNIAKLSEKDPKFNLSKSWKAEGFMTESMKMKGFSLSKGMKPFTPSKGLKTKSLMKLV